MKKKSEKKCVNNFTPRILRSMKSDCWGKDNLSHAELISANQVYTDTFLRTLVDHGYDSIWVHVVLRETVPSAFFPKPDKDQLDLLNRLVDKTAKHGIKVYVYLCEPRGLPADSDFWTQHPEARGKPMLCVCNDKHRSGIWYGMCTSVLSVRNFIEESCYNLFKKTPGLGGTFLINASEFFTHCYSHYSHKNLDPKTSDLLTCSKSPIWQPEYFHKHPIDVIYKLHHLLDESLICPRCWERDPSEVVAELITTINRGIKTAAPEAEVIAWSWAWGLIEAHPQTKLIQLLPDDVTLMTDWETCGDGKKEVLGKKYPVNEYSLSYIGPCNRFKQHLQMAKQRGRRIMAKLQVAGTHELATVPYIPVPFNLAEKMKGLKKYKVDGFLGCWNFGGEISPMTKVAGKMSCFPEKSTARILKKIAIEEFGENSGEKVVSAWKFFSEAWKEYPFSCNITWFGPLNYATAFQFPIDLPDERAECTAGYMALPRDKNGHLNATAFCLTNWTAPFGHGITEKAFVLLLEKWNAGVDILKDIVSKARNENLTIELNLAQHIALSVKSTINIIRFYTTLPEWKNAQKKNKRIYADKLIEILREEKDTAREDIKCLKTDPRLGYHPEAHVNLFTGKDLEYKITVINRQIRTLLNHA